MEQRKNIQITPHAVCFFDLLNQQAQLAQLGRQSIEEPLSAELDGMWRRVITDLFRFRSVFDEALGISDRVFDMMRALDRAKNRPEISQWTDLPVQVEVFADSAILFMPLDGISAMRSTASLTRLLMTCSFAFGNALANGLVFRGGIEIGFAASLYENDARLYGPAVYDAYKLENSAGYPRIVVGQRMVELIAKTSRVCPDTHARDLAMHTMKLLTVDEDGKHIVHYAGGLTKVMGQPPRFMIGAKEFAASELVRFRKEANAELIPRYEWLVRYLDGPDT